MNKLIYLALIAALSSGAIATAAQAQGTPAAKTNQTVPSKPAPASVAPLASNPVPGREEDCGCEAQVIPDTVAEVNSVKISRKEVDDVVASRVRDLERQVIDARQHELYLQINTKLLELEAQRRGKSMTELLDEEIVKKVKEPTEAEAQDFFNSNKDRIRYEFKDVKDRIIDHLRNERQRDTAKAFADRLRGATQVVTVDKNLAPQKGNPNRARILVTVGKETITSGQVEDALRPLIFSVQKEVFKLRKEQLDLKINDLLLQREATARKLTTASLLEMEVTAKTKKITEDDVRAFFEANKAQIGGEFSQQKERVLLYLQEQENHNAETAFAKLLRDKASVGIYLKEPEPPTYQIATDDQPSKGDTSAPVTIVEFTDFQCSYCAETQPVIERILAEYKGKVRLVIRDYPLEQHANAFKAAEAAEAAREQGKYWEYVTLLMKNQTTLDPDHLKIYAGQIALDRKQFDEALDSGRFADKVQRDMREGNKLGINATPTIFINGREVPDKTLDGLKAATEAALYLNGKQEKASLKQ
jgi:protein-disulfide isomerase